MWFSKSNQIKTSISSYTVRLGIITSWTESFLLVESVLLKSDARAFLFVSGWLCFVFFLMQWMDQRRVYSWTSSNPLKNKIQTGCPERLWSLPGWRYSRPAWTRSCAACCRWPCVWFSRGLGLVDPQRSLPTPTILWFCEKQNHTQNLKTL